MQPRTLESTAQGIRGTSEDSSLKQRKDPEGDEGSEMGVTVNVEKGLGLRLDLL